MAEKILFAICLVFAAGVALVAAGMVRDGARNMSELFNGVQIEKESGL